MKVWQQLAPPGNASVTPPVNSSRNASPAPGRSPAANSARRSPAAAYVSSSPQLPNSRGKDCSPSLPRHVKGKLVSPSPQSHVKGRLASPVPGRVASPAGRLVSPLVRGEGAGNTNKLPTHTNVSLKNKPVSPALTGHASAAAQLKRISPSNSRLTTPNSSNTPYVSVSPASVPSRPDTPNSSSGKPKGVKQANNSRTRTPTPTPTANNHSNQTPNVDHTNRKHAGNKKRRRSDDSIGSDASSVKKPKPVVNGETITNRPAEPRAKTSKVKTTVELIAELQAAKSTRLTASDTITKIVTNQIEKEEDDINVSVVPPSAKPRHRRKNGSANTPAPPAAPADLSRTKSDLVHRFLQQVEQSKEEDDVDVLGTDSYDLTKPEPLFQPKKPVIDLSIDPYSLLPPLNYDEISSWSDDEPNTVAIKRNAITGEYPDGYDRSPSIDSEPDERIIDKVVDGEWDGVNGTVNNVNNEFNPWTETFTISSTDEAVHVLPYVDL